VNEQGGTQADGSPSPERRAREAEEALRQALAERNRLWEEVQRLRAGAEDAERSRERIERLESSAWWRAGAPLRLAGEALRDPARAFKAIGRRLER
jgi:hypothetical protein